MVARTKDLLVLSSKYIFLLDQEEKKAESLVLEDINMN